MGRETATPTVLGRRRRHQAGARNSRVLGHGAGESTVMSYVSNALRARQLASDRRAGRWARGQAWSRQLAFVRRSWRPLAGALLASVALAAPGVALTPAGFTRGFVTGSFLVGVVATLWAHVVRASGTGPSMMGDLAEQWTASDLRRLRKRGWRLVNGVRFGVEIDHVLVGPGGVIAVESKWSAASWASASGHDRIGSAVDQVRRGARQLRLVTELRRCGVEQVPGVVVLWGPNAGDIARHGREGETAVIAGEDLAAWCSGLPLGVLTDDQVRAAWSVLDARCRTTDAASRQHDAPPPSLTRLVSVGVATCSSGLAGLLVGARCLASWHSLGWWTLVLLVPSLALGPVFDRLARFSPLRPVVWAWTLGVAACLPLIAMTALVGALT
jgi:hypothetical protein